MKHFNFVLFSLLLCISFTNLYSQDDGDPPPVINEIWFLNQSSTKDLTFRIFPVSMIFNELNRYDLQTATRDQAQPITYNHMTSAHVQQGNPTEVGNTGSGQVLKDTKKMVLII